MKPSWWPLSLGDTGPKVSELQRALRVPETGTYDEPTLVRVRGWQSANGLPITGEYDRATAESITEYRRRFNADGTN